MLGLGAADRTVWQHAKDSGCVLVTRDEDFQQLSLLHGAPPKVIWLSGHNLSNARVVDTLLGSRQRIEAFVMDRELALLELR
jgi:predicted nuclease of predicted toxin-antitoxin system